MLQCKDGPVDRLFMAIRDRNRSSQNVPLASKTALFFSLQVTKISLTPVGECVEL
jgi:hypothetical protein